MCLCQLRDLFYTPPKEMVGLARTPTQGPFSQSA
jgi:hypothetical protein